MLLRSVVVRRDGAGADVRTLADDGDITQTGFGFSVGRHPGEFDLAKAAREAADRATRLLGAVKPASKRVTVVLDPYVTSSFLGIISSTLSGDAVAKPLLSREGANVSIRKAGSIVAETAGDYGEEGYIYQSLYRLPEAAPGCFPVLGSWVVDGAPVGMGIREDGLITGNTARFVPHVIDG